MELRNEESTVFSDFTVLVIYPTVEIINLTLSALPTEVNTVATINTTMFSGSQISCMLEYGDGSHRNFSSPEYNPLYGDTHTYTSVGNFLAEVTCQNTISTLRANILISIQERLTGFNMSPFWIFEVGTDMVVSWNFATGGNLAYTAQLDDTALSVEAFDVNHTLGSNWSVVGDFNGWIHVENLVSQRANVSFTISVGRSIANFSLSCPSFAATYTDFNLYARLGVGSETDLDVMFPNPLVQSRFIPGDFTHERETFNGTFTTIGVHQVNANCSNILVPVYHPQSVDTCFITAENAVGDLNVTAVEGASVDDPLNVRVALVDPSLPATNVDVLVTIQRTGDAVITTCLMGFYPSYTLEDTTCPINVSGWYNITSYFSNNVSSVVVVHMVPIGDPLTDLWYEVLTPLLTENQVGQVRVKAQSKHGASVQVDYGDGYMSPPLGISPNVWVTIEHNYTGYGDYDVNVTGWTPINGLYRGCEECIVVQEEVSNIQVSGITLYTQGNPIAKTWTLGSGSHLQYIVTLDGSESGIASATPTVAGGTFTVTDITQIPIGYHVLDVRVWNNLSGPINDSLDIVVVAPITGLVTSLSHTYVTTNDTVNVTYFYTTGSMVTLQILDHLQNSLVQGYYFNSSGTSRISELSFSSPGTYTLKANATNLLGTVLSSGHILHVQNPIIDCDLSLSGSAEYQTPVQLVLRINPSTFDATDYSFTCTMANGISTLLAQFVQTNTTTYSLAYTYAFDGTFNVTCTVSNDISLWSEMSQVQVGTSLGTLTVTASTTLLEISDPLIVNATITTGSNMAAIFNFGDGTSTTVSIVEGVEKSVHHTFSQPGDYQVSVNVTSVLGEVINTYPSLVLVQRVIDTSVVAFVTDAVVYPVDSSVTATWSIPIGSNISSTITYSGSVYYTNTNTPSGGNIVIPGADSPSPRIFLLSMQIANLLTSTFTTSMIVQIEQPLEDLALIPEGFVWPIRIAILFDTLLVKGSNVSLTISYDDGYPFRSTYFATGRTDHKLNSSRVYNTSGDYIITASAVNPLGSLTTSQQIQIQIPIYNGELTVVKSGVTITLIHLTVTFNYGDIEPTNWNIVFDMGDGQLRYTNSLTRVAANTWTMDHLYQDGGQYDISVRANNNVSDWSTSRQCNAGRSHRRIPHLAEQLECDPWSSCPNLLQHFQGYKRHGHSISEGW